MEDIFEGIIGLIVIIASICKVMNRSKKVRQNAPGKAAAPAKPAAPAASAPGMRTEQEKPVYQPAQPMVEVPAAPVAPTAGQGSFWQQVSQTIQKELGIDEPESDPGHGAVNAMPEGDSRECEHGSIGGSMAYDGHPVSAPVRPSKAAEQRNAYDRKLDPGESLYRPAMNAQEMRQAVVMAEILKRPQERMAEQARRWSVR